jgi:hypothetical protein
VPAPRDRKASGNTGSCQIHHFDHVRRKRVATRACNGPTPVRRSGVTQVSSKVMVLGSGSEAAAGWENTSSRSSRKTAAGEMGRSLGLASWLCPPCCEQYSISQADIARRSRVAAAPNGRLYATPDSACLGIWTSTVSWADLLRLNWYQDDNCGIFGECPKRTPR